MPEYDTPWKEALYRYFERFLEFFFAALHALIDWTAACEGLDTELRKLVPEAEVGKRLSDALVKCMTHEGDERYLHVEIQCQVDDTLEDRADTYNGRIKDRYGHPPVTLLVLGDDDPEWKPKGYLFEWGGFRKELTFPNVKFLDWRDRLGELETHGNPVALLLAAHLWSLDRKADEGALVQAKVRLLKAALGRAPDREEAYHLTRLLDWLLPLPVVVQRLVWDEVRAFDKENAMPFMSYPEQIGLEKGRREGLLTGIELGLERFGEEGEAVLHAVRKINEPALLTAVLAAVLKAQHLDEVRRLLPAS